MPRIVVAVPVHNGASLLGEALANLQNQTHRDFEIVVLDNASTDATAEIAERAASTDKRVRVVRRSTLVPAIENFTRALESADCDFFAWRAYDDLSAPNYLAVLSGVLQDKQSVGLAVGSVHTLKPHKSPMPVVRRTPSVPANRALAAVMLMNAAPAAWVYGLFRRDQLELEFRRAATVLPQGWATDHLTLFPYLIGGTIGLSEKTHFVQRIIKAPDKTDWSLPSVRAQWDVRRKFYRYCAGRIDDMDFDPLSRATIKAALPRYAGLRTFRLGQMLARSLKGTEPPL